LWLVALIEHIAADDQVELSELGVLAEPVAAAILDINPLGAAIDLRAGLQPAGNDHKKAVALFAFAHGEFVLGIHAENQDGKFRMRPMTLLQNVQAVAALHVNVKKNEIPF